MLQLKTHTWLHSGCLATRFSPLLIGGRIVDTDSHYLLRLRVPHASGPVSAALPSKDGSSNSSAEVGDEKSTVIPPLMGATSLV